MKRIKQMLIGLYGLCGVIILINSNFTSLSLLLSLIAVIWLGMNLAIYIKDAVKLYKDNEIFMLRNRMKILKGGLVPFFILNFLICSAVSILALIIFAPIALIFIAWTYYVVVSSSAYGIAYIVTLKNKGEIGKRKMILHIIMQLCFCLDVADTIYLLNKYR